VDGWSCDYYDLDGILISTGYQPLKDKNITARYDVCRKYEQAAQGKTAEEKERLIAEFVAEISKTEKRTV